MKKTILRELFDYLKLIIFVIVAVLVINNFVIVNALIPSESMENTIMTGDRLFGNRLAYNFGEPARGDIIIFKYPIDEKQLFIKRLIGLPGDEVKIEAGKIYINGSETPVDEPYLREAPDLLMKVNEDATYQVPEGSYFMMGDNRNHSSDSRVWGFVSDDLILGKAVFRYFPFSEMGTIK